MSDQHTRILAGMRRGLDQTQVRERGLPFGTSHPTGIPTGYAQFRTDLGLVEYYDGTRWLTVDQYYASIQPVATFTTTSPQDSAIVRLRTDYAAYFTRISIQTSVNTTNNATNFWTVDVNVANTTFTAGASVYSFTTAADTLATRTSHEAAPSTPAPANATNLRVTITKTLTPGTIELGASAYYRLIIP